MHRQVDNVAVVDGIGDLARRGLSTVPTVGVGKERCTKIGPGDT